MKRIFAFWGFLFFLPCFLSNAFSQNSETITISTDSIPLIENLKNSSRNPGLYDQYQKDVELRHKAIYGTYKIEGTKIKVPQKKSQDFQYEDLITFYKYTVKKDDSDRDFFSFAAKCGIRPDTLASLNHIAKTSVNLVGKTLILPSMDGIFVPENAITDVDQLIQQEFQKYLENPETVCYILNQEKFYFIRNAKFSQTDRAFFVCPDDSMVMPLEKSRVTSPFGNRISPISGQWKMHTGIDLASPLGSAVMACKSGSVEFCVKGNPVYGNYIVLRHDAKMTSVYAHLGAMLVQKGQSVKRGEKIAEVGLTGQTTGPHLHFEIRTDGKAEDPAKLLPK